MYMFDVINTHCLWGRCGALAAALLLAQLVRKPGTRRMARLCRFTLNGRAQTKLRTTAHRVVRLLLGLAWILMAGDRAQAQPAGQRPARVVTRYALTAAPDTANQDPENWRLLGSNDGGATWTLLDARTNQVFEIRSQRRSYSIPNQTAFNIYRLQVDKWNRHAKVNSGRVGVELAEFELIGDSSTEGGEEGLHRVLTASCAHPLLGPPENAFDNDPTTRWVDFGLGRSSGCWIQCEYVAQPNTLVTNIRELQIRARLDALRGSVMGKGALIRSNLALRGAKPLRVLTGYALTSANDEPGRDPRSWRLLGSNDGGSTWTTLDTRQSEVFPTRFKRRIFSVAAPSSCVIYRLQIDAVGTPESNTQIGEIEPIYALRPSDAEVSIVVSARSENPPFEAAAMAFDEDPKTKWLSLDKVGVSVPPWVAELMGLPPQPIIFAGPPNVLTTPDVRPPFS